jgi:hypothetical protein
MSGTAEEQPRMELPSITDTVTAAMPGLPGEKQTALIAALTEREDRMADLLRMAGHQFGLYPWIVAEVFAQVGIGTAPDTTTRAMIRVQFEQGMEELARQHREQGH